MKSILDKSFRYTPAIFSDIRERFDRVKKEIEREKERAESIIAEAERVVAKTKIKGKTA